MAAQPQKLTREAKNMRRKARNAARQQVRREAAEARQAKRDSRTSSEQISKLAAGGHFAKKERLRLMEKQG